MKARISVQREARQYKVTKVSKLLHIVSIKEAEEGCWGKPVLCNLSQSGDGFAGRISQKWPREMRGTHTARQQSGTCLPGPRASSSWPYWT